MAHKTPSPPTRPAHLASPGAIPPRTSSTNGPSQPQKSALLPLPESSWLSSRHSSLAATVPPAAIGQVASSHSTTTTTHPATDPTPWSEAKETILTGPYDYLDSHPGKDIRSRLIGAFDAWLHVPAPALAIITRVVGMLHTASLLVDDVEDSSLLRRGLPVAHSIFGTAQTINSANYVYFLALQELFKLDELRDKEGEMESPGERRCAYIGMDLYWRDTLTVPTEADYLEMVRNKTGGLFRLAVRLMQAESASTTSKLTPPQRLRPLASLIGTLYQIRDDYANLLSPTYSTNKGLCEDLTEGKFSFPIIHAIRADPSLVLLNILRQKSADEEVKRYAVAYMEGKGSFAYCREVLKELGREAQAEVERVSEGKGRWREEVLGILGGLAVEDV
ncbi:geranylgeranyl pyrophosphate synthetase [Pseudogymnoascus australis]